MNKVSMVFVGMGLLVLQHAYGAHVRQQAALVAQAVSAMGGAQQDTRKFKANKDYQEALKKCAADVQHIKDAMRKLRDKKGGKGASAKAQNALDKQLKEAEKRLVVLRNQEK